MLMPYYKHTCPTPSYYNQMTHNGGDTTQFNPHEETLRLQTQVLETQIEIQRLEYENQLEALQKRLRELQQERNTLGVIQQNAIHLEETHYIPSEERDLTETTQTDLTDFSHLLSSGHSLESSVHSVTNPYYPDDQNPSPFGKEHHH